MDLQPTIAKVSSLASILSREQSVRQRIAIANQIFETLTQIEHEVEKFIVAELAQRQNGNSPAAPEWKQELSTERFAKSSLVEGAKILLAEDGTLHGKDIERRLKGGGYPSTAKDFQTALHVAFKRNGSFENVGGNRWRLKPKEQGQEQRRQLREL